MGLKAAAHMILVTPTGDNREAERGGLFVIQNAPNESSLYRGVVEHVGKHVADVEEVRVGNVAHYSQFAPIGDKHLVSMQALLAYEDDDE